eukprot:3290168-Pyramimonas_sp.AAC.1
MDEEEEEGMGTWMRPQRTPGFVGKGASSQSKCNARQGILGYITSLDYTVATTATAASRARRKHQEEQETARLDG